MPVTNSITFTISPIPTGEAVDANQYAQLIASSLQASLTGNFLTGQIDGPTPTQNIGVWLNQGVWYIWNPATNSYVPQALSTNPAGTILMYGGTAAPSGYLLCDGTVYLRSSFPALYAVIGDAYGPNDGVSTFRVPDFRGRAPVGAGTGTSVIGSNLGDLSPRTTGSPNYGAFGEEKHLLLIGEVPSHTHTLSNHTHTMGNHTHVGANHTHSMQGHTHTVDHAHSIPAGQFNHSHADNGHVHGYISWQQTSGPGSGSSPISGVANNPLNTSVGFASIAANTLPAGGTSLMSTSGYGTTSGGPNIASTSGSEQALTTSGPSTNTTDPAGAGNTGSIGGGASHNVCQPSMICGFIIKS